MIIETQKAQKDYCPFVPFVVIFPQSKYLNLARLMKSAFGLQLRLE